MHSREKGVREITKAARTPRSVARKIYYHKGDSGEVPRGPWGEPKGAGEPLSDRQEGYQEARVDSSRVCRTVCRCAR